ncbi:porin family protein [Massilia sp. 9I]|uniref:porin family protein n=1 Tax=Massilia sp. 9I TaxID=2653152 RepID=UPI0012F07637|nr:porin family protein [Massilia sp. 9I]VXC23909.1 OmpA-like domain-containing protein [Massilia sp. 9I]
MKKLLVVLIASAAAMSAAQAQSTSAPRAYVGAGIASADHDFKQSGASNVDTDGWKASGKIFGGYDFNQTWGVEAGYTDFAKSDVNYSIGGVNRRGETDGHAFYVAGKATLPVNEQFSVYGKLGATRIKNELEIVNASMSRSKTEAYGAVGAEYKLNQNVSLVGEYERYGKSKDFGAKADVLTIGAKYAF